MIAISLDFDQLWSQSRGNIWSWSEDDQGKP